MRKYLTAPLTFTRSVYRPGTPLAAKVAFASTLTYGTGAIFLFSSALLGIKLHPWFLATFTTSSIAISTALWIWCFQVTKEIKEQMALDEANTLEQIAIQQAEINTRLRRPRGEP